MTQGATLPSDYANAFDMGFLGQVMAHWARLGLVTEGVMDAGEVAEVLVTTLAAAVASPRVGVEHLVLRPPFPVVGSPDIMIGLAAERTG